MKKSLVRHMLCCGIRESCTGKFYTFTKETTLQDCEIIEADQHQVTYIYE
jgi:hypothetical protein